MATQSSNESAGPVMLAIGGMTCGGCAGAVSRALSQVPGVIEARVDLAGGRVTVTGTARPQELIRAVEAAGFAVGLV
ncbi:MAG: heavy-metal-associated domain-containing protein [Steroidobacteraceae bacterium]